MENETRDRLIIQMYEHRKSIRAVAKVFNLTYQRIQQILAENGIKRLSTGRPKKKHLTLNSPSDSI